MRLKFKGILLGMLMIMLGTANASAQEAHKSFTPEVMMQLYRISGPEVSPDGKQFLYSRSLPNLKENNSKSEILIGKISTPGSSKVIASGNGYSATFLGKDLIAFIDTTGDHAQLAVMNYDGSNRRIISNFDFDVNDYRFSPDLSKVIIVRAVDHESIAHKENPDLDKISGEIFDDLMYKHWDHWVKKLPQSLVANVQKDLTVSEEVVNILGDEKYELPIEPFGGIEQLAWSPDSKTIAYSCKKLTGMAYAKSTNTDIYLYNLENGTTKNVSEGMMGYDTDPQFSPDGKYISWISMERDGYEADLKRLFIMDLATGKKSNVTEKWEHFVEQFAWMEDSKSIRFLTNDQGLNNLFDLELKGLKLTKITNYDMADVTSFSGTGRQVVYGLQSMKQPTDIYTMDLKKGKDVKLTTENDDLLKDIPNVEIQKRWITTTDGKKMLTWVILPPNFDENKQYPAILYCQGGPQSTVSQFWSYRWNLRTFASHGYIMVAPNRRGVPGFGKEWNEQISGDWGGQNMKDLLMAIDTVAKEPYVDENRLGATGASYGGFTVYWLAGHHEGRFKSFAAHAGIFNFDSQYLETEEKFFADWDMGGAYWEDNETTRHTYANSPHRHVIKWDTPILVTHGNRDYRILASQGLQAFDAAKLRGIPARMLYYPDESHWILQPQNGVLFYRTWFDWMDRWLKK
ncbi:S9 family peptidase [Porphyromonadaceae bacterium W3.11]|nr:S9 family peptidase [Porphyromonadaceae bacterium W3.11]